MAENKVLWIIVTLMVIMILVFSSIIYNEARTMDDISFMEKHKSTGYIATIVGVLCLGLVSVLLIFFIHQKTNVSGEAQPLLVLLALTFTSLFVALSGISMWKSKDSASMRKDIKQTSMIIMIISATLTAVFLGKTWLVLDLKVTASSS